MTLTKLIQNNRHVFFQIQRLGRGFVQSPVYHICFLRHHFRKSCGVMRPALQRHEGDVIVVDPVDRHVDFLHVH